MDVRLLGVNELTDIYRRELQSEQYKTRPIQEALKERLALLKNDTVTDVNIDGRSLLHTLDVCLQYPHLIDPLQLVEYITALMQVMENLGAGSGFTQYIDKAIDYYRGTGLPLTDLYLAKAKYIRIEALESTARKAALDAALNYAQNSIDLANAVIAIIVYYLEAGQNQLSIEKCREGLSLIEQNQIPIDYKPDILARLGMNLFDLFHYQAAQKIFEECHEIAKYYVNDRRIATSLHYLGRIAFIKGDFKKALEQYLDGLKHEELCSLDLAAIASIHLRVGELLTISGLLKQALDHLLLSQDMFRKVHYSFGIVQVDLALADVYIAEGKIKKAENILEGALRFSEEGNLVRGKLICLEKIFFQNIGSLHFHRAMVAIFQVLQIGNFRLLRNYLLQFISKQTERLKFISYKVDKSTSQFRMQIETCTCPIHNRAHDFGEDL